MTKTYSATMAEITRLQEAAERLRKSEAIGVISQIRKAIEVYGITAADLGLSSSASKTEARKTQTASASKATSGVGAPKFRDPKSGKTWTGRGKPPTWIAKAKNRDVFAIDAPASTPTATASLTKTSPSIGVAKYRDPKSGKTWTGRGKPPTWIAMAKDRDVFAINVPGNALSSDASVKRAAKAATPTTGVAKYRDPKTGKTWTGRGKPPNWIARVKNRASFEVEAPGAEPGTTDTSAIAENKAEPARIEALEPALA